MSTSSDAMDDSPQSKYVGPLDELYEECMQTFRELMVALSREDCRPMRLNQIPWMSMLYEIGAAEMWGGQLKIDLAVNGFYSFDNLIKISRSFRKEATDLLEELSDNLEKGQFANIRSE